jgi:hypothetical protein
LLVVVLELAVWWAPAATAEVVLVEDGEPTAAIVVSADAEEDEQLAAREIQQHLRLMSGAEVPIPIGEAGGDVTPVLVGAALVPDAEQVIREHGDDPASLMVRVTNDAVHVAGLSPEGTLFAAYELLEQLGCRWYAPGTWGAVVPTAQTISLAPGETVRVPSFQGRHLQAVSQDMPWYRRVRLGGPRFPAAHGLKIKADVEQEPELFSLVNGERVARQWCTSNPEVVRRTAERVKEYFRANPDAPWIGLGPNDGRGFCECDNCRALDAGDWDPFGEEISVTDRYMRFFSEVLHEVHKEFPGKKIGFYSYSVYMRPPLREKPDPHIVPAFAPITLCRVHGMNNPVCPERSYYGSLMEAWGKIVPEIYERGYYFNLACPGFPFSKVHAVREETPFAHRAGVKGWRVECIPAWGSHTPTLYVAARLMWDAEADVDALLNDFYAKFFGSAAVPMKRYLDRMDAALRDGDFHTGCSYNMPDFYSPEIMKAGKRDLTQAARLARGTGYGERVAGFRLTYDYLAAFIEMLEQRNAFRWEQAKAAMDEMLALQEVAVAHDPPLLSPRAAPNYMRRFWSGPTEEGYERTTGASELVAGLPDEWAVYLDPNGVGEDLGLYRAATPDGNWLRLRTKTASWSDQGLRYYKGGAWYRASVSIAPRFRGRKMMLWFGGADEKAKVWVNGVLLGESPGKAFKPFELDATGAVRFDGENQVTVYVINERLNELGTGGLTGPVMFWAPGEGQ